MPLPLHGQFAKQLKVVKSTLLIPASASRHSHGHRSGILKPFLTKARSIPLCIHPFASIQKAFCAGVPEAAEEEENQ
jgi:hypothetical protein